MQTRSRILLTLTGLTSFAFGDGLNHQSVNQVYQQLCLSCHGAHGEGGIGGSLIDGNWAYGGSDLEIAAVIRDGVVDQGMPAYGQTLDEKMIRGLVVHLRELSHKEEQKQNPPPSPSPNQAVQSNHHLFKIEKVVDAPDRSFWSVNFLPDQSLLLSDFKGEVLLHRDGRLSPPVQSTPEVWRIGQGGLLDVVPHPKYEENGWIYLSFAELRGVDSRNRPVGATTIVRGKIRDGVWVNQEIIFEVSDRFLHHSGLHFGCRIVFQDDYLFFSLGDRGPHDNAQDLSSPYGKIHRIHLDGSIPSDNPFVDQPSAFPSIYSLGNRNPQGLAISPLTGELWETEHGPRGGDEVNIIRKGLNYGWPKITHGINYNGRPYTDLTSAPGFESPVIYWVPSIAVCGMDFLKSNQFPAWDGDLFVGGLRSQQLHRLKIEQDRIVEEEILFKGLGNVRDIAGGPDGFLYAAINLGQETGGAIYRLVPASTD
ncbi:MAG: PQQ-dependent sugar dehydrogenase [Puniceicoccaceae bacterium]